MNFLDRIKRQRLRCYIALYRLLPIKENKIIMWADSFKHYGCSPKYITEYLLKNYPGEYDIVWVFDANVNLPELPADIRTVRYFSLDYLKELHTSHFIVCNARTGKSYMWKKRPRQKYIQTWHSSIRLKKIEKDAENNLPYTYIKNAKNDSVRIDLLVSGCDFSTSIFENAFWYSGKILKSGTPRCDIFFSPNREKIREKVFETLRIASEQKMVLYAPTFRNDKRAVTHELDFEAVTQALNTRFGGNFIMAYRFHPNILTTIDMGKGFIDASQYPDMQELIAAADVLLTDYSSCMFDMAVAGKPCFLYCPDLESYMSRERGLYFNPAALPFSLSIGNYELTESIRAFDESQYRDRVNSFLTSVGSYEDGKAAERIVDYIRSNMK